MEVIPLHSKAAREVAIVIYRKIFARYGRPKWIRVDAGREWEGDSRQLSELLGVTLRVAAAGYPQTNGQSKRIIPVIKAAIGRFVSEHHRTNWWDWLPEALMSVHFGTSGGHGMTLYYMAFKQDPYPPYLLMDLDESTPTWTCCARRPRKLIRRRS